MPCSRVLTQLPPRRTSLSHSAGCRCVTRTGGARAPARPLITVTVSERRPGRGLNAQTLGQQCSSLSSATLSWPRPIELSALKRTRRARPHSASCPPPAWMPSSRAPARAQLPQYRRVSGALLRARAPRATARRKRDQPHRTRHPTPRLTAASCPSGTQHVPTTMRMAGRHADKGACECRHTRREPTNFPFSFGNKLLLSLDATLATFS